MDTITLIALGGIALLASILLGGWLWYRRQQRRIDEEVAAATNGSADADPLAPADENGDGSDAQRATIDAPEPAGGLLSLLKLWRHRAKARKLAAKGYVKWYKVDSRFSRPQWIKPEKKGAGEWEYYDSDDDATYLFPEEAMVSDPETGAWVCVHNRGEVDPINLRDPIQPPIDADRFEGIIQLEAEDDKPGFLSRLSISPQMLLWGGVFVMLVLGGLSQVMGG